MSIEKIGKMDQVVVAHPKDTAQKQQKAPVEDGDFVVHEPARKDGSTRISYPPFFPLGDTQSIYKK